MPIRYTADHEWVVTDGPIATVGITDHAQGVLGDLVFVQLPEMGAELAKGGAAGVVESVKAASDIFSPLTGQVVEVNPLVVEDPAVINSDPTGRGWLFKLRPSDPDEFAALLDEAAYRALTAAAAEGNR